MSTDTRAPVEGKVWAATVGGGAGATVAAFLIWLMGVTIWGASATATAAGDAVAAVPLPVVGIAGLLITAGSTFVSGYLAKHTPRPSDDYEEQQEIARRDPSDIPVIELDAERADGFNVGH